MAKLLMAVGIPASGKSFFYENFLKGDYIRVSSDAIREEVFGDVNDQSHNAEVFQLMWDLTVKSLKAKRNVYYDATNLSAKRRIGFLKSISHIPNIEYEAIIFAVPFELAKERNAMRSRVVPEEVMNRMLHRFEVPHESEGWDKIIVSGNIHSNFCSEVVAESLNISHDNPHHSLSIGGHMEQAEYFANIEAMGRDHEEEICCAAAFHDIAKPFVKVFQNSRGKATEYAHYYNHENVGAYFYLSHSCGLNEDIYIANLICHHMDFFKGEKYLEKIRNRMGEEFFEDLSILHKADLAAH